MADQKRWFKVWTSILDDPHFQELSLEDIGRWTLLGAMTALTGERGRLPLPGTSRRLREVLRVDTAEALCAAITRLPNVCVEEGNRVNGCDTVTWKNWRKYQEDSTVAQRVQRLRSKRRGEEIRGDEKDPPSVLRTGSPSPNGTEPLAVEWPTDLTEVRDWLISQSAPTEFHDPGYWRRIDQWLGGPTSGVAYLAELTKFLAHHESQPKPRRKRHLRQAFRNWLAKSEFWSDSRAQTDARRSPFPRR